MGTYKLRFLESARKEWNKLGNTVRGQFIKKLEQRLVSPHVPAAKLAGMPGCYKIKLRDAGYRLIYRVHDAEVTVLVIAVGRRDKQIYGKGAGRNQ